MLLHSQAKNRPKMPVDEASHLLFATVPTVPTVPVVPVVPVVPPGAVTEFGK